MWFESRKRHRHGISAPPAQVPEREAVHALLPSPEPTDARSLEDLRPPKRSGTARGSTREEPRDVQ